MQFIWWLWVQFLSKESKSTLILWNEQKQHYKDELRIGVISPKIDSRKRTINPSALSKGFSFKFQDYKIQQAPEDGQNVVTKTTKMNTSNKLVDNNNNSLFHKYRQYLFVFIEIFIFYIL